MGHGSCSVLQHFCSHAGKESTSFCLQWTPSCGSWKDSAVMSYSMGEHVPHRTTTCPIPPPTAASTPPASYHHSLSHDGYRSWWGTTCDGPGRFQSVCGSVGTNRSVRSPLAQVYAGETSSCWLSCNKSGEGRSPPAALVSP